MKQRMETWLNCLISGIFSILGSPESHLATKSQEYPQEGASMAAQMPTTKSWAQLKMVTESLSREYKS